MTTTSPHGSPYPAIITARLVPLILLVSLAICEPFEIRRRDDCAKTSTACNPKGVKSLNPPTVSSGMNGFYVDVVDSVSGIRFSKRDSVDRWFVADTIPGDGELLQKRDGAALCCAETTQCVLMKQSGVPFCYDKFTTNYFLPDGSYGTVSNGSYHSSDGSQANLLSGEFSSAGQSGNLYSASQDAKPNTATLAIPPQWTGTGVGSAIPATGLGGVVVNPTVQSTTITGPTTIPESTVQATTISDRIVSGSTISGRTVSATTMPAKTITGATTLALAAAGAESAQASQSAKKGHAASLYHEDSRLVRLSGSMFAVMSFTLCFL